jgi:biofilm protein TabA
MDSFPADNDTADHAQLKFRRRDAVRSVWWATLGVLGSAFTNRLTANSKTTNMNIVTGDIKSWRNLKGVDGLEDGLEFLEKTDLSALSLGKHEIKGEDLFATVSKTPSRAPETGQFEAHRKYIDIQYLIAGAELIGVAPTGSLKEAVAYDQVKDFALYSSPGQFTNIEMFPSRFVVFFPENAHLPLCHFNGSHEIHKVVVKMSVDYWKAHRRT